MVRHPLLEVKKGSYDHSRSTGSMERYIPVVIGQYYSETPSKQQYGIKIVE